MTNERDPDDGTTAEERLDGLARRAGRAYRKDAPDDGVGALRRRRQRQVRMRATGAVLAGAVVVVGAAAISRTGDDEDATVADAPTTMPASDPATTVKVTASSESVPALVATSSTLVGTTSAPDGAALAFTLGAPEPASGEPVKIGLALDGDPTFEAGVRAGAGYLNEQLGGLGGRPIELVACDSGFDNSIACGARFVADDDVLAVISGGQVNFDGYLEIPTIAPFAPSSLSPRDDGSARAFIVGTDGAVSLFGVIAAALTVVDPKPRTVVVYSVASPALKSLYEARYPGVRLIAIDPPADASAEQIAELFRSTPGALEADAVAVASGPVPKCTNLYDGLQLAGSRASVVTFDSCVLDGAAQRAFATQGVSPLPENWVMLGASYDPTDPENNGWSLAASLQETFLDRSAAPDVLADGFGFGLPLLLARAVNQLGGPDVATRSSLRSALSEYRGPGFAQFSPIDCTAAPVLFGAEAPGTCATYMGAFKVVDGEWVAIANGTNGKLIGLDGLVDVPAT